MHHLVTVPLLESVFTNVPQVFKHSKFPKSTYNLASAAVLVTLHSFRSLKTANTGDIAVPPATSWLLYFCFCIKALGDSGQHYYLSFGAHAGESFRRYDSNRSVAPSADGKVHITQDYQASM
jgi:hypothetical protein